ncbi:MAG: arginine--tRNA ligase [Bacteroidetes bacterium]|nr:arginine--tRNA ligase [Bacteroidota bacterium]
MIEQQLQAKTSEAIKKLYGQDFPSGSVGVEKTKKEIEGDFTIVVFPLSKISGKSPLQTANDIGIYLKEHLSIGKFNVIHGFLNIILKDEYWISFLEEHFYEGRFGLTTAQGETPVLVEYSSPNTNKPLHLGHIRNNLLGFSLARILQANGQNVIKLNLVNDRGIHICKSMLAYMKWGKNETPSSAGIKSDHLIGKYYVIFDKEYKKEIAALVEGGMKEEDALRNAPLIVEAQDLLLKWEAGDPGTHELWSRMSGWAFEGFTETYRTLGVDFDVVQKESDTYLAGKDIVMEGVREGLLEKHADGSIWADLRDEGLDEKLLLRSDGTSVYMTQDLGTADLRYREFRPSKMIYVVGNEQNYHFDVLRRILHKLGHVWSDTLFHLSYGMVELPEGKMKSREGTVVDADDLMQEMFTTAEETTRALGKVEGFPEVEAKELFRIIGLGALKYFILKVDPKKNMLFDPKESIDFNGNTGPFIQYTYARIKSLLRKAEDGGWKMEDGGLKSEIGGHNPASSIEHRASSIQHRASSMLLLPREKDTLRLLYQFPEVVAQAGEAYSPAAIANYVYELSRQYNQFYQEIPVLKEEDENARVLRLKLSLFTGNVIKKAMWLLGIEVPERM